MSSFLNFHNTYSATSSVVSSTVVSSTVVESKLVCVAEDSELGCFEHPLNTVDINKITVNATSDFFTNFTPFLYNENAQVYRWLSIFSDRRHHNRNSVRHMESLLFFGNKDIRHIYI